VISRRTWPVARRYALPPFAVGLALVAARRRWALVPFAGAGAVLLFFRDPERTLVPDRGVVYAAADGIVTRVDEAETPWLPFSESTRISTFLSLHNVHVTRSPIAGTVVDRDDRDGRLVPALSPRAGDVNRQSRLVIEGPHGQAGVVLVAGAVARRITSWVHVGDDVRAGTRLALIHFGSRTDVLLPAGSTRPLVRPGSRVVAARTPIAYLPSWTRI
jgi:phosphatidylserine decarboxylase